MDSRFTGRLTSDRNIETDRISAGGSDFLPSPESSLSKSKTTHYIHFCVTDGPKIAVTNCNLAMTEARLNDGPTTDDDGLAGRSLAKDE